MLDHLPENAIRLVFRRKTISRTLWKDETLECCYILGAGWVLIGEYFALFLSKMRVSF